MEGTRHRHDIMTMLKESSDTAIAHPLYKKLDKKLKGIIRCQILRVEKRWSDDMSLFSGATGGHYNH